MIRTHHSTGAQADAPPCVPEIGRFCANPVADPLTLAGSLYNLGVDLAETTDLARDETNAETFAVLLDEWQQLDRQMRPPVWKR